MGARLCQTKEAMTNATEFFAHEQSLSESVRVAYSVQVSTRVVVVENVPAQANRLTSEQLFSADISERLLEIAQGRTAELARSAEALVYSFAA